MAGYARSTRKLYRSRRGKLFGVCQGIADWRELDVDVVRLVWVLLTIFTSFFPGVLLYFILTLVLPLEPVYREEGRRESTWFVDGVVKYHRTVETYVNTVIDSGLVLRRLGEPEATPEAMRERPDLIETRRRPAFLLLAAEKPLAAG